MPRPGPRRTFVGVRLGPAELEAVQAIADAENGGNQSETIRMLLGEAIQARQRAPKR